MRTPGLELIVEKGPSAGERVVLARGSVTIGADGGADLVLAGDEFVSSPHATIVVSDGGAVLRNVSANGTLVNGRPVSETPLAAGDRISIGLLYLLTVRATPAAPPPGSSAVSAAGSTTAQQAGTPAAKAAGGFRLPVWLMAYLALMGILFIFFSIVSLRRGDAPDLKAIQTAETAYASGRKLPAAETERVLRLLETAVVHERRGDMRSAYEVYREVLGARLPVMPQSPAYRYAAGRMAALGAR